MSKSNKAKIRIGTSSFSEKSWVGPFYPTGMKPGEFLNFYSQQFDTVEIDSTYYAVPSAAIVERWRENTPEDFLISAKFPRSIVHAGEKAAPDSEKLLSPEHTYEIRDVFLDKISRLEKRLGILVLQFPYFSKKVFSSYKKFFELLNNFLEDLPTDFKYGVEIRNRAWLKPEFANILRNHNTTLVMADQAWMPHGDELEEKLDPMTTDTAYLRLIGDRKEIEALTKTWDKELIDRGERLERWADLLTRLYKRQINSLVYINNHYAGHAPETARRLSAMIQKKN